MVLSLEHIRKAFQKDHPVISDCSFELKPHTCSGLIGKNGAGKSTLLKMITGLISPGSGLIRYFDQPALSRKARQRIGFYLGANYLPEEMTGFQFLELVRRVYQAKPVTVPGSIASLIDFFFEDPREVNKLIRYYSFGMCQKIGICAALLTQPDLLILDEPFSGLDAFCANNLLKLLLEYKRQHTLLISSHDLHYLGKICDRILLLDRGLMLFDGSLSAFTLKGSETIEDSLFKYFTNPTPDLSPLSWLV